MVTELLIKGMAPHKLQVIAETYAGRVSMLKIRDAKTMKLLTEYKNHEWIVNRIPLHHVQEIIEQVLQHVV